MNISEIMRRKRIELMELLRRQHRALMPPRRKSWKAEFEKIDDALVERLIRRFG